MRIRERVYLAAVLLAVCAFAAASFRSGRATFSPGSGPAPSSATEERTPSESPALPDAGNTSAPPRADGQALPSAGTPRAVDLPALRQRIREGGLSSREGKYYRPLPETGGASGH